MTNTQSEAAKELYLYMTNCADAWKEAEYTFRLLERKRAKGIYDATKARKGMVYAVETAARCYVRDHCARDDRWHKIFAPADRAAVADMVMNDAETEWAAGNYWTI